MSQREVEYRAIQDFPGYRVGDDGSVWTCRQPGNWRLLTDKWTQLRPTPRPKGYLEVKLVRDKKRYGRYVHRLVLEAFVGPCPDGMEGCHFPDRDPGNNRLENLRWATREENHEDSVIHGTAHLIAGNHPLSKLTEAQVREIMRLRQSKGLSGRAIIRELGLWNVTTGAIYGVLTGACWNHITGLPLRRGNCSRLIDQ